MYKIELLNYKLPILYNLISLKSYLKSEKMLKPVLIVIYLKKIDNFFNINY